MIFPLYKVELKGKVSVIVKDAFSYGYRKVMKIPKNAEMYNSGVVLFDWQKYQQANYGERCYSVVDTVDTYGENNSRWSRHTRYRITKKVEIMEPRYNLVSSYYEFTYNKLKKYRNMVNFYDSEEIKREIKSLSSSILQVTF